MSPVQSTQKEQHETAVAFSKKLEEVCLYVVQNARQDDTCHQQCDTTGCRATYS